MANVVRITVDAVEDLLNAGMFGVGAILRLQSSALEAGPFADETSAPLVAGQRIYTLYDPDGASTAWYRTRYENAGGTSTSDWSAVFQAGAEDAGGICSLYDVKQRLTIAATDTANDEDLAELITEVTTDIIGHTGRRFVRLPLAGDSTFLFDVARDTREFRIPRGIATATQVEVATTSQPESGGTYTVVSTADWMLRPVAHERDAGWPATQIVIRDNPSGAVPYFYAGRNVVRLTGALGWDTVPADISGIAQRAVVRRWKNRGAATVNRGGDPTDVMARWTFSLEEQRKLDWYRVREAG